MLLKPPVATVNLILFTSPSCRNCPRAKKELGEIEGYLKLNPDHHVITTLVDATEEKDTTQELLKKYDITSVPTLVATIREDGSESVQTMIYTGNQIDSADVLDDIVYELGHPTDGATIDCEFFDEG